MNFLGGDTHLWHGGVNVGPRKSRLKNLSPVAEDDAILVVAGGTAIIPVLLNDMDPEGQPLAVTSATAQYGTVTIEEGGTLSYTAPAEFSGTDTVSYTIADPQNANGIGTVSIDIIILSIVQGETAEEFVVNAAPGEFVVLIGEPADYAGEYRILTADLAGGPANLVPPKIAGTGAVGETLSSSNGLWAFDEASGPLEMSRQWLRNGEPIDGASGPSRVVTSADAGSELVLRERGATLGGAREADSGAIPVAKRAEWTPASLPGLALWLDALDPSTITMNSSEVVQWNDKSGNGRHATRSFGAGPVMGTINGKAAIDIGVDQALSFPAPGISGAANRSVLMAVGPFAGDPLLRGFLTLGGTDSAGTGRRWCVRSDAGKMRVEINGSFLVSQIDAVAGGVVGAYHSQSGFSGTALSRDGDYHTGVITNSTALATLDEPGYIGRKSSASTGFSSGPVGEVILCAALLPESDRQKAEGYLAHKWGYAGLLPAAHPFKTFPPLA